MSSDTELEPSWSPRRWSTLIFVLFAGHLGVIRFLGRTPPVPEPVEPSSVRRIFAAIQGPLSTDDAPLASAPVLPTLRLRDLQSHTIQAVAYPLADAVPAPRWLGIAANARQLGTLPPEPQPALVNGADPLPELPEDRPARIRAVSRTLTSIEGGQLGRRLVLPISPIDWNGLEPLPPTVTEIIVNAAGRVISARVIESSGNKAADALAHDASFKPRFLPLPGVKASSLNLPANLEWGRIRFRWGLGAPEDAAAR